MANLAGLAATIGQLQRQSELTKQIDYESRMLERQKQQTDYTEKLQIEGEKRAQAWELEKMELTSKHNFVLDEQEYEIKRTRAFQERLEKDTIYDKRIKEGMEVFKDALADPAHPFYNSAQKWLEDLKSERAGMKTEFPSYREKEPTLADMIAKSLMPAPTGPIRGGQINPPQPIGGPTQLPQRVEVVDAQGNRSTIPNTPEQRTLAVQKGYTIVEPKIGPRQTTWVPPVKTALTPKEKSAWLDIYKQSLW